MPQGYMHLLNEMKVRKIKVKDMQEFLGINRQALSYKLHGKRNARFSVEQAISIKKEFFPDSTVEELFSKE